MSHQHRRALPLLDELDTLGSIEEYREDPERLESAVHLMDRTLRELAGELDGKEGAARADFALSVIERLVETTQQRAGNCMEKHTTVACENTDVLLLVREWIALARRGLAVDSTEPT